MMNHGYVLCLMLVSTALYAADPAVTAAPAASDPIPELPGLTDAEKQAVQKEVQSDSLTADPNFIRLQKRRLDETEQAASAPAKFVPKPVTSSSLVDLRPGAVPPVVRLSRGYITNIVFVDQMGNPLMVRYVSSLTATNNEQFKIDWVKPTKELAGQNNFQITPVGTYSMGNVSVRLEGMDNVPVSVTFISGQRIYDDRAELRVMGVGVTGVGGAGLPKDAESTLLSVLAGIPPVAENTKELKSSNPAVEAWVAPDADGVESYWLRSKWTLMSPAWLSSRQSTDGTHAYKIRPTPVLNMSIDGTRTLITLAADD